MRSRGTKLQMYSRLIFFIALSMIVLLAGFDSSVMASDPTRIQQDVHFQMDDGTDIVGSVFLPPASAKMPPSGYPLVVIIHGWGGDRSTFNFPQLADNLAQDGFAVLTYDTRGFGQSGGLAAVASRREIKDMHTLMRFMLENRTSFTSGSAAIYDSSVKINPQAIGSTGISYGGGHSLLAAASNYDPTTYVLPEGMTVTDPRSDLKNSIEFPKVAAIAPIVGWTDLYEALNPNGIPKLSYNVGLSLLALGDADPITYDWIAWSYSGTNEEQLKKDHKERSVLQDGVLANPNLGQNSINEVPIYMLQTWEDYLFPVEQATTLYRLIKDSNPNMKLYLGNTGHPPASLSTTTAEAKYMYAQVHNWFSYWLKGRKDIKVFGDQRIEAAPEPGTYPADTTADQWGQLTRKWGDLPATDSLTFYLQDNQRLTEGAPTTPQLADVIVNNALNGLEDDPIVNGDSLIAAITGKATEATQPKLQPLSIKPGNVYYFSEPLLQDKIVFGQPKFDLYLASNGEKIQFAVKVYDLDADENAQLLTRGLQLYNPAAPLTPALVSIKAFSDYHRFPKGHRIAIELAASDAPYYKSDLTTVETQLFHDNSLISKVVFPVLP